MIKTSKQLKDLIRNLPKANSADAQVLKKFSYAAELDWHTVMNTVRSLYESCMTA